nr:15853_t:CDS:2 [Entrophospora candida]CAG8563293.1 11939_t:CDS:2 [Entrophospora candida]
MQNINQDVHNLQEALKNPNLNPQIKQEKETKLNYYNTNLLRSSITAPMQNTSSSQIMSSQSG